MAEDVVTPLGYVSGEMEVVGMPKELNMYPTIIATGDNNQQTTISVPPGKIYAMALAPGHYEIHATFATATSVVKDITVANGKTVTLDFAFGKDPS